MGVERLGGGKTGAVAITAATNVYGIFGDPVIHSLSPLMQNAAFAACGINAVYLPFNVTKANLDAAVLGAKAMNVRGVNVTIPHKEAVCPLLDSIDGSAQLIGAVNTIVNSDGCLVGYNTDGVGLVRSLRSDLGVDLNGNVQVVVLGAGGAARAAVVALAQQGVKAITVVNRTLTRAQRLVDACSLHFPQVAFSAFPFCLATGDSKTESGTANKEFASFVTFSSELIEVFKKGDLIVNSTSIGLSGESFNVLPWERFSKNMVIYDMIYSAYGTPLVRAARAAGFLACDGLGMLAAQGEAAFELWTGHNVDGVMRAALDMNVENAKH